MIKKYFKRPISVAFAPNFQQDDVVLALKLFLNFINKNRLRKAPMLCKKRMGKYQNTPYVYLFSSGRAALYYALKSLGLKSGNEVITQAFTCVAVPNAICWAGLHPIYVDIDENTYNINVDDLRAKITKKTRAIIIQHTFGIPGPVEEIQQIARKHNIYVVEDCAHGFGSKYKNASIGAFGDISIFSFGRDKALSCVFGGAASTKNKLLAKRLKIYEKELIAPSRRFVLQQLFYLILYTMSLPFYKTLLGKILLWGSAKTGVLSKAVSNIEKQGGKPQFIKFRLSPKLCALLLNQLGKLAIFNKHRLLLSKTYSSALNHRSFCFPLLRFPYTTPYKQKLLYFAKIRGIYLGDWYNSPVAPSTASLKTSFYQENSCPNAERAVKRTVNLPTHINISMEKAKKIIKIIKDFERKNNK